MAEKAVRVGDVAVMLLSDGGYGACQVTDAADEAVAAYALSWHSTDPPTLDDLRGVEPLRLDHHSYARWLVHVSISRSHPVPADFVWIGNLPVPQDVPAHSGALSDWRSLASHVPRQRDWDLEVPAAAKTAYRAAVGRGDVTVDFGGGPAALRSVTLRLDLTPTGPVSLPDSGPVNWSALDRLPRCTTIIWAGPDQGLADALAGHPIVWSLTWRDAPAVVDLAHTRVRNLTVIGPDLREVRVPRHLRRLELVAPHPELVVRAADEGRWLHLTMRDPHPDARVPAGLQGVRELTVIGSATLSATLAGGLGDLQYLRLFWGKPPGELRDAGEFANLTQLSVLEMVDGYGLDPSCLPELPSLQLLSITGLRRSIVPALKNLYRGSGVNLVIQGAKSDSWLAINLHNPFRDWVDDDPRAGAAACKAYAAAARAVDKLPQPPAAQPADVEAILHKLVETLNAIEHRSAMIDTLRREQAWEAFAALAVRAAVSAQMAENWFDEWRDF